jgi:hypothetical protein
MGAGVVLWVDGKRFPVKHVDGTAIFSGYGPICGTLRSSGPC